MKIHIAAAFDLNYRLPFFALLASIVASQKSGGVHLHLIVASDVPKNDVFRVKNLAGRADIDVSCYDTELIANYNVYSNETWPEAAYYRLLFSFLVPADIERIIYLDSDTLVLRSLEELYKLDLKGYPVAAVYDNYVKKQPKIGISEEGEYFNSGMMLIDLQLWNNLNVSHQVLSYVSRHPERIEFADQCGLNAILVNNWLKLDSGYNLLYSYIPVDLKRHEISGFLEDKRVIHFTLERPWRWVCKNRLRFLYFQHLRLAGFSRREMYLDDLGTDNILQLIILKCRESYTDSEILQRVWRVTKLKFVFKNGL